MSMDGYFNALCAGVRFGREDGSRYGFHVDAVDGLSSVEVEEVGVPQYDGVGQFDFDNRIRDPRIITISGTAYASSMWELGKMEDLLRGCLADPSSRAPFTWTEYGRTRWAMVRRYRGWRFQRIESTGAAEFEVKFRAPSQLVFGEAHSEGPAGSVTAINRGTFRAYPVLLVTGSMPSGYRVTAGGTSYVVDQALSSGQTHSIDMLDGVLRRNGVPQPGGASSPRILTIPASSTRQFVLDPVAGSGQLTVESHDTY